MYSEKVMKHFRNPKNVGEIKNPDGVGRVGNPVCGDVMWLYIKVGKDKIDREIIKDIKFKTFGCVAAIATSSAITEIVKGKTIEKAEKFTKEHILDLLGDLPPIKVHCSVLAIDALKSAIKDYKKKKTKR